VTQAVAESVTCVCGYSGPAIAPAGRAVCPICHTPAAAAPAPRILRIPCPRGHVLKAGEHLLGQQVVCPDCNEMFLLREDDSLERRQELKRLRQAEEERIAKLWLARAIWAAAFIVASLVGMIAFSFAYRAPPPRPPVEPPSDPAPAARTE